MANYKPEDDEESMLLSPEDESLLANLVMHFKPSLNSTTEAHGSMIPADT